jgi:hypothetical protein
MSTSTARRELIADYAQTKLTISSFITGEHGFYPNTSQWDYFFTLQRENPVAGSLVWGLRPHTDEGGFETHGEGKGIFSYHVPGWSPPVAEQFDPNEQYVVAATYSASFQVVNETVPFYPTPWAPTILAPNTTTNGSAFFTFIGGAWGEHYEVYRGDGNGNWIQAENLIRDNVRSGDANVTVDPARYGDGNGSWIMRGVGSPPLQPKGPWSNIIQIGGN